MKLIYPVSTFLGITQRYSSSHLGIDLGWRSGYLPQIIIAPEDGTVTAAVDGYDNTYPDKRIYGNYVMINHGDGIVTLHAHLLKGSVCVKKGDKVTKGQPIGTMGNTGFSHGTHCHSEVRVNGVKKNPADYYMVEGNYLTICEGDVEEYGIKFRDEDIVAPVERNTSVDQCKVNSSTLRVRTSHSTSSTNLGFCTPGYFNIYESYPGTDYTWYCIDKEKGYWIAKVKSVDYLEAQKQTVVVNAEVEKQRWSGVESALISANATYTYEDK